MSIHEIGHASVGVIFGCKYEKAILFDSNFVGPYTELYCSKIDYFFIFLSSLIITSSFSSMFLFLNSPTKNLFLISLGLSIIFSSLDVTIATNIQSLFYPIISLGFMITAIGEYFIADSYFKNNFLDLLDIEKEVS